MTPAYRCRPPSDRALRDEYLTEQVHRVYDDNFCVYGAVKVWKQLHREGIPVARCTVERRMRQEGLQGVRRGRRHRTTRPNPAAAPPPGLVDRDFSAPAPNRLWLADLTYVSTGDRLVYLAVVVDAFSRLIAGWALTTQSAPTCPGRPGDGPVAPTAPPGRPGPPLEPEQYTAIRYTHWLAQAGIQPSVGSVGDSYENALAESVVGLHRWELTYPRGPWTSVADLELATMEWITWFLFSASGGVFDVADRGG